MRILFLSQLIPYPVDAGPKVRIYYVLRHLAAAGHEVTLLAFSRASDSADNIDHLRQYCTAIHTVPIRRSRVRDGWHFGRSLLSGRPFLIARDDVPAMFKKAREIVQSSQFDAIHADQLWMASYALAAHVAAAEPKPTLVLDQHNAVHLIPRRLAESTGGALSRLLLQREAKLMSRYEQETCRLFDHVVWVTTQDRAAVGLPDLPAGPSSHVIPICVDPRGTPVIKRVAHPHRVTFLGGLHWPPNAAGIVWFAREVWPRIRTACPEAILTIIGKSPPGELDGRIEGIEVTGFVDDPTPYLTETAAFVVPLHAGGGMRVKILDAWTWGLPVVSTSIGAEGIAYHEGENLLIADDPAGFAQAVIRLVKEPDLAIYMAWQGRSRVEQNYEWETGYLAWDNILTPQ